MAQELKLHRKDQSEPAQRRPMLPLGSAFDEIDRLFDAMLPAPMFALGPSPVAQRLMDVRARAPRIDLVERDTEMVLRAEVPGMNKDDLDISVDESSVTLRGSASHEEKQAEGDYYRREISREEFVRTVALPGAVDTEKTRASLKDGVLELVMPKLEAAKRRKVSIG